MEDTGQVPEFSAARIHFDERYPLIGGDSRGAITRIHRGQDYYTYALPAAKKEIFGISVQSAHSGPVSSGSNFLVLFDGDTLSIRPSNNFL
jgi:hypothetical protein